MVKNIMSNIDTIKAIATSVREIYGARKQGEDWAVVAMRKFDEKATDEELKGYSNDISSTIDDFNLKFTSIQQADAQGISTVQWMKDILTQNADGAQLEQVEKSLAEGNLNILETMENADGVYEVTDESLNKIDEQLNEAGYTESAREEIIAGIVRQAEATGAGTAILGDKIFPENNDEVSHIENEMLDSDTGSKADKNLKTMVAVVLKIGACMGKLPFLTKRTPMALITNIACVGVETARTSKMLFDGKIPATQAVDRMAQVTSAATASLLLLCVVPKALSLLGPYGAIAGMVITPLLATVNPEPLQRVLQQGLEMVKPLAVPLLEKTVEYAREKWNTIKETAKGVLAGVKELFA